MSNTFPTGLYLFIQTSSFAVLVPFMLGLIRWKEASANQRLLTGFLAYVLFNQALSYWLVEVQHVYNNMPLYYTYVFVETLFLSWFLGRQLIQSGLRQMLLLLTGLVVLTIPLSGLIANGFDQFPAWSRTLQAVLFTGMAILYFEQSSRQKTSGRIELSFWFWIAVGLLAYFPANLLLFGFGSMLNLEDIQMQYNVWAGHALINLILYAAYTLGLLCKEATYPSSSSATH